MDRYVQFSLFEFLCCIDDEYALMDMNTNSCYSAVDIQRLRNKAPLQHENTEI